MRIIVLFLSITEKKRLTFMGYSIISKFSFYNMVIRLPKGAALVQLVNSILTRDDASCFAETPLLPLQISHEEKKVARGPVISTCTRPTLPINKCTQRPTFFVPAASPAYTGRENRLRLNRWAYGPSFSLESVHLIGRRAFLCTMIWQVTMG